LRPPAAKRRVASAAANPDPDPDAPDDPLARARLRSALGSTEVGLGENFIPPLPHRREKLPESREKLLLESAVAGPAFLEGLAHRCHFLRRSDEREKLKNRRRSRILPRLDRRRIGHDAHDPLPHLFFFGENVDRIAITLAHLLAVEARHRCRLGMNPRLGQFQDFSEGLVHLDRDIARQFEMLFLVAPDRHNVAVVDQNVGRHQDRVGKEAARSGEAACDFVLIRMSPLQQSHRRYGAENPGQLSYLRHIGLAEEGGPVRIKSAGEEIERHSARIFP